MLFRFHHEGLGAFEESLPGTAAFDELGSRLSSLAAAYIEKADRGTPPEGFEPFLTECRGVKERVLGELASGRDRLLELGSYRPRAAESLIAEIRKWDENPELDSFVVDALDSLGVEWEAIAPRTFVLRQGKKLVVSTLPGLRADEVGMTSDRDRATREGELDFLTWDHPLVIGVLDLLLGGEQGSVSVALLPGGERGLLLEGIFVLDAVAPPGLDVARFLPPTPLRAVVDHRLSDVTEIFPSSLLEGRLVDGRKELRFQDLGFLEDLLPRMLEKARALAKKEAPRRIKESREEMRKSLSLEIGRLRSLAEVNDHVDPKEVSEAEKRMKRIERAISAAALRLDSMRLLFLGRAPSRS
jgi:ATP-dependent helicase HepA